MKQKTMIEVFQLINKSRQSEEMPITPLAMFAEAWDYRQAEIDALQARLEVAESNLNNTLKFVREEQSVNDALQKRIDDALKELNEAYHKGIINKPLVIVDTIEILKGDKND